MYRLRHSVILHQAWVKSSGWILRRSREVTSPARFWRLRWGENVLVLEVRKLNKLMTNVKVELVKNVFNRWKVVKIYRVWACQAFKGLSSNMLLTELSSSRKRIRSSSCLKLNMEIHFWDRNCNLKSTSYKEDRVKRKIFPTL